MRVSLCRKQFHTFWARTPIGIDFFRLGFVELVPVSGDQKSEASGHW
jgi:hypothetical protein